MDDSERQTQLVQEFCSITGATPEVAMDYLTSSSFEIASATSMYFADQDEAAADPEPAYTGPRTLDGRPAPEVAASSSAPKKAPKKKGIATLGSLGGTSHDQDDDDDDEEDEDDDRRGDLFAGGEKSGLAVQDPNQEAQTGAKKIIGNILNKAKANARPTEEPTAGPSRSRFRGTGTTLGGDGVESRAIPDPEGPPQPEQEVQERVLHLWRDGFSIEDGELRRFDDPANAEDLRMIQQGKAPLHLMNVRYGQPVDVKLEPHDENYRPLPKVYRPFGGEGRRLGSPVPGEASTSAAAATAATAPVTATGTAPTPFEVDSSQPVLTLRIQLPTGTRLPARFNTTHTIGDVYQFVQGSTPDLSSRPWVLATTFPTKDHTDKTLILGEMAEFKKGGTAVVKWV